MSKTNLDALLGAETLIAIAVNRLERAGEPELRAHAQRVHQTVRGEALRRELKLWRRDRPRRRWAGLASR